MEILDWAEGNAEKLVQKYLDVEPNEVFSQNELKNKGDYYIGTESSGDGQTMFIDVCFGDEFEKHDNNLEKNYEYFTRYAEDISDNMNYDVTVMTNSDDQTIMFQFTDWFPEESEEPKEDYASGGKVKEKVFIEYLNKDKGYKMDRKYFNSYQEAERWARDNFDKFDTDYIRYEYADGGKVKEWKGNLYVKQTSVDYFGDHEGTSKSPIKRWFRVNRNPMTQERLEEMAKPYIEKFGKQNVKTKNFERMADGGEIDYWGDIDVEARKIYKPIGIYSDAEKEVGAFKEGFIWGKGQEKYDRDLAENEGIKKYKPVGFRNVDRKQAVAFWEGARFADSEKGKKMAEGGELQDEDSLDYNSISDLQSERNRLVRWSNQYGSKGADYKIKKLEERIEYLKSKDSKMADGGELEDDTFVMLFKGYGFVEKRGSYGTKTFYNKEHNAYIYYDPKYRSISGYVGGGEGNDEVIPYSVEGVLDFFIEHDISESEPTPLAKGGLLVQVGDKIKTKSGIQGVVYESTGQIFKLMDSLGVKSNTMHFAKDFKKGDIKSFGKGGSFDFEQYAKGGKVKNPAPDYPDFVSMQYEKGGEFKPYGKTKGKYKIEYTEDGEKQSEFWESKEMVEDRGKRLLKLGHTNIKITELKQMAKGGSVQSKYVITYDDGDDISRVWVYARNEEDAQEQAFEEYSDIKEIISVEKMMSDGGMMAKGGENNADRERMYNFLKDDLVILQKSIEENNQEEIDKFFSYWNHHLNSLEPKMGSKRMYNFLKDDLVGLEAATKELPSSKEETDRFFSYWNTHLKSLSDEDLMNMMQYGGMMAKGGEVTFDDKVKAISKKLEGKPVPVPYRKEYGSRYDKEDAQEAARRIVGNMRKLYGE